MKEIHTKTEIEINAPVERVWGILTDFARFPEWNPFIRQARGELKTGARLEMRAQLLGSKGTTFQPTVMAVEPNRELRWLGRFLLPGMIAGDHRFLLQTLGPERTRFIHEETFRGLLVPLLANWLGRKTRQGFEGMNRALKTRAEEW